jgi:hypothetical protein
MRNRWMPGVESLTVSRIGSGGAPAAGRGSACSEAMAMMLRVREQGEEVQVDLDGVAGHQQRVLLALSECQRRACLGLAQPSQPEEVSIRSGSDRMRIRLKGREGHRCEAAAIYACLRAALIERRSDVFPRVG